MGNCVAPTSDHGKIGRDEQMGRDRNISISSKSEEAKDLSSPKSPISCEKTGKGVVRVKLVIRKEELAELLANGLSKREAMADLLAKNCGTAARMSSYGGWKPSLERIPEDKNTDN